MDSNRKERIRENSEKLQNSRFSGVVLDDDEKLENSQLSEVS